MNPVHTFPSYFTKILVNIVFSSIPRSSKWSLFFSLLHQNPVCIFLLFSLKASCFWTMCHVMIHQSNHYCHTLQKLCNKIKNKHHGKFTDSIILLHNNACSHVPDRVQEKLNILVWWKAFRQPGLSTMQLSHVGTFKALRDHPLMSANGVRYSGLITAQGIVCGQDMMTCASIGLFVGRVHWSVHQLDCLWTDYADLCISGTVCG